MLNVSEHFYSIQGEGFSVGVPAYFIRLQGCNLMCGGAGGELMKSGKATWWCDSEAIWRQRTPYTNEQLLEALHTNKVLDGILGGDIHLVWTGGEPTLPKHQSSIVEFLSFLRSTSPGSYSVFNEIETNGTILMSFDLISEMDQINCSPKLANSGMDYDMRVKPVVIDQIKHHKGGTFKFVVSSEDDLKEIERDFIKPFDIPKKQVCIMPGVDNRDDLPERTRFLFDMAKQYGYRAITRQHILAWNRVTGV